MPVVFHPYMVKVLRGTEELAKKTHNLSFLQGSQSSVIDGPVAP